MAVGPVQSTKGSTYLADRAKPGLLYKHLSDSLIHSLTDSVILYSPTALQRHHTQTVREMSSSYEIDYVIMINNFLNPEGHENPISASKVKAILLKGWILPIGGVVSGRVCT